MSQETLNYGSGTRRSCCAFVATVILAPIFLFLAGLACLYVTPDEYHVATLDCGCGRKIVITAESFWERSQAIYYRVVVDGETVVPTCLFNCDQYYDPNQNRSRSRNRTYRLVSAENGDTVAVVSPDIGDGRSVLILHDFRSGISWPQVDKSDEAKRRVLDVFHRLKLEYPDLRLRYLPD